MSCISQPEERAPALPRCHPPKICVLGSQADEFLKRLSRGILLEIIRRLEGMEKTLRGRPSLNIPLERIIEAVRRHGQVVAAAGELRCSDGYIHKRFKQAGLTLAQVLESPSMEALLRR